MNERTRDWLDRADNARSVGDSPTADFCKEQADWHMSNGNTISSEECARIAAAQAKRWAGALELLGRDHG